MLTPVFSVTEFNEMVSHHLGQLGDVEVEGEISELKVSQNKWIYATIKDEGSSVNIFATIYQIHNLNSLDIGMLVKVTGTPSLYQKTARFSLNASAIVPSGEGALAAAYEKLKKQLEQEGLFAPERKRTLPMFPQTIGLLTAKGSQAYNDFVKVTEGRIGGVKILFYPVQVQGSDSVNSVISALTYFNTQKHLDLLVITRGGGSLEDLASFNDERLVRAIFASTIPTVAAIGHEGDISLAELASDLRASTPSNAAELIFRDRAELVREIDTATTQIKRAIASRIDSMFNQIAHNTTQMARHFDLAFSHISETIDNLYHHLDNFGTMLSHELEKISHLEDKLTVLDPHYILKKGYSIVKDHRGRVVSSITQLAKGDVLLTTFSDGNASSLVQNINRRQNEK